MDESGAAEVRRQCVARLLERRRPLTERVLRGVTADLVVAERDGSEYLDPETVSQWADYAIAHLPWIGPHTAVLYAIASAARAGADAACREVRAGRKLVPWDQFHCYTELRRWRDSAQPHEAKILLSRVLRAWEEAGLADERPGFPELPELPDPPRPPRLRYPTKWGVPAGRPA